MTEAEAARFRAKMAELSAVLEDELNQLEEQNNKLLVRTSRRAQWLCMDGWAHTSQIETAQRRFAHGTT